jgi:transposase
LEQLFTRVPALRPLYELRVRFKQIFDKPLDRRAAGLELTALFLDAMALYPSLETFVCTYERWQEQILNYFDDRRTSGVVEGINNKARVITKRAYGLKSAASLWTRLVLDLNRAQEVVQYTIAAMHEFAHAFQAIFSVDCG